MKTPVRVVLTLFLASVPAILVPAYAVDQSQSAQAGGSSKQALLGSLASNWDTGDFECAGTVAVEPTLILIPTVGPCVGKQIALSFPDFNNKYCTGDNTTSCLSTVPDCNVAGGFCVQRKFCTGNATTVCVNTVPDCNVAGGICDFKQRHLDYTIICEAGPPALLKNEGGICVCDVSGLDCDDDIFPDCVAAAQPFDEQAPLTGEGVTVESEVQAGPPFPVTLKLRKLGNDIVLSWTPNCFPNQNHGIHEGSIAALLSGVYDHTSVTCFDPPPLNVEVLTPRPVSTYYLVVPNNLVDCDGVDCVQIEGSYGQKSPAVERATSITPCAATQVLGATCD